MSESNQVPISGGQGNQVGDGNTQNNYYNITLAKGRSDGQDNQNLSESLGSPTHSASGRFWNVPLSPNPFFTGREEILERLKLAYFPTQIVSSTQVQIIQRQALSGLGGIGKTQTAVEYAYRSRELYRAVLWAKADSASTLDIDYVKLATLLELHEKDSQNFFQIREAVKRWLSEQEGYLLILDNADSPDVLNTYLPPNIAGHLLITSRVRTFSKFNIPAPLELSVLTQDEAISFLFKRTGRIQLESTEQAAALELVQELDCLPLALEQAGAYIAEQRARFSIYLKSYRKLKLRLLEKQKSVIGSYEETVATTWSLNFDAVKRKSKSATMILRMSAFFASDPIPEELLIYGISAFGPAMGRQLRKLSANPLLIEELLTSLANYSLIHRDTDARTFEIHRLVQVVIQHKINIITRRAYAKRAILAVYWAFPWPEYSELTSCDRLLPHALICSDHLATYSFVFDEATHLLNNTGCHLHNRAQYAEAETQYLRALALNESAMKVAWYSSSSLELKRYNSAHILNNLATLYKDQGRFDDAERLYMKALATWEYAFGETHPDTVESLNDLAQLYENQGRGDEAELLYVRALTICEDAFGWQHPNTTTCMNNLALFYEDQGRYNKAEDLYLKALNIWEYSLAATDPYLAICMNNLALFYKDQGRYNEAESLYVRALSIREQALGIGHHDTADVLNNLATLYKDQRRYPEAEPLYNRALSIREQIFGDDHLITANSFNHLAMLYEDQGKYKESEALYLRALGTCEKILGSEHLIVASILNNMASFYRNLGQFGEASSLYIRARTIRNKMLAPGHPDNVASLYNLAFLYEDQGQYSEAESLYVQALEINSQSWGAEHPNTASSLNRLAMFYESQNRYDEAKPLYVQAKAIRERMLEPEYSQTKILQENYLLFLKKAENL